MSSYKIHLIEYFEESVKKNPNKIAVEFNDETITFKVLFDKVKHLAYKIKDSLGEKTNCIIAVHLPKSIDSVIADLAILMSSNAYMNLDVSNPITRLKSIKEQVNPSLIISSSTYKVEYNDDIKVLNIDSELSDFDSEKELKSVSINSLIDTDPCCVINTSGSTGVPKSVILNHRSFIDFIESIRFEGFISDNEIVGSLSPSIFDIYSFELCMLMAYSSKIVIIPDKYSSFPVQILKLIDEKKVSFIFWVPTIMVNIANMDLLSTIKLDSLKMVWFAGEVFPTSKFNYWFDKLSNHCRFVNLYGPIEITLDCLFYEVKNRLDDNKAIPIGRPFRNTSILVLDENNNLVKAKEEGELCIRGSSLAMGYYNNPEKTSAAFVQNPLNKYYPELIYKTGDIVRLNDDGDYEFLGRKDSLIKRFGYRIELSEIEHVVVDTLQIAKNCCVIFKKSTNDLVLLYEADKEIDGRDWHKALLTIFPKYMVPNKYIYVDLLPRNANGKIDRNALKQQIGL